MSEFSIEKVLVKSYPSIVEDKGADLDGNGTIEGNEQLVDENKDGKFDADEFWAFFGTNHEMMAKVVTTSVDTWIKKAQKSKGAFDRLKAGEVLIKMGDESGLAIVRDILSGCKGCEFEESDDAISAAANAAKILGKAKDKSSVPTLIEIMKDETMQYAREAAALALGEIGDKSAVPALIKALDDEDEFLRRGAVEALGIMKEKMAVPKLIDLILTDDEGAIRNSAAKALDNIVEDKGKEVYLKMFDSIKSATEDVISLYDYESQRKKSVKLLMNVISYFELEKNVKGLTFILNQCVGEDYFYDYEVLLAVFKALGNTGDKSAATSIKTSLLKKKLMGSQSDKEIDVIAEAVAALGKLKDDEAGASIFRILKVVYATPALASKKAKEIEGVALEAFKKIAGPSTLSSLKSELKNFDTSWLAAPPQKIRLFAVSVVEKIDAKSLIPELISVLGTDPDEDVRAKAAKVLGELQAGGAVKILTSKLKSDSSSDVREACAGALGIIGDKSSLSDLIKTLKDTDSNVGAAAAWAIGILGGKSEAPKLIEFFLGLKEDDSYSRSVTLEALGRIGDESAIPAITEELDSKDAGVRAAAAKALGNIGSDTSIKKLFEVAEKKGDMSVCDAAMIALAKIKGSTDYIKSIVNDTKNDLTTRLSAAEILANIEKQPVMSIIAEIYGKEKSKKAREEIARFLYSYLEISYDKLSEVKDPKIRKELQNYFNKWEKVNTMEPDEEPDEAGHDMDVEEKSGGWQLPK